MKRFTLALLLCLGGCAAPHLSLFPSAPPSLQPPTPPPSLPACPGFLLAPIPPRPEFPSDASIPKPKTVKGKEAEDSFLDYVSSLGGWGVEGWKAVADAQKYCSTQIPNKP